MRITINLYRYATQTNYAKMKGVTKQVVGNWITRGRLEVWYIDSLGIPLVKIPRKDSELRKQWLENGGL